MRKLIAPCPDDGARLHEDFVAVVARQRGAEAARDPQRPFDIVEGGLGNAADQFAAVWVANFDDPIARYLLACDAQRLADQRARCGSDGADGHRILLRGSSVANCSSIPILNVPKDSASLALIYSTKVFGDYQLTGRISDSYVGPAFDQAYAFGIPLPSYNIANARVGLGNAKWSATLFVDNLTNKLAELTTNNAQFQFNVPQLVRVSTNQPRTFGTEINYRF